MGPFIALNPFNQGEWWEISGNTRRLVPASQRAFLQLVGTNPVLIAVDWFLSYPIASG